MFMTLQNEKPKHKEATFQCFDITIISLNNKCITESLLFARIQQQIKQMELLPSWNLHLLLTHTNEWVSALLTRDH